MGIKNRKPEESTYLKRKGFTTPNGDSGMAYIRHDGTLMISVNGQTVLDTPIFPGATT